MCVWIYKVNFVENVRYRKYYNSYTFFMKMNTDGSVHLKEYC